MNINGIETQYQNYGASGDYSTKSSSQSTVDTFQKEIVNWEKRIKETLDKQQENDINGSIQMSEKQWRNLMKKINNEIGTDNNKGQDQEKERQREERILNRKDTVVASFPAHKMNTHF